MSGHHNLATQSGFSEQNLNGLIPDWLFRIYREAFSQSFTDCRNHTTLCLDSSSSRFTQIHKGNVKWKYRYSKKWKGKSISKYIWLFIHEYTWHSLTGR